jgi:probable HAF family extracellular repeat protein
MRLCIFALAVLATFWADSSFLQAGYVITDLGTLGGSSSAAYGINAGGQVVGYSTIAGDSNYHGFLFDQNHMTDLGTYPAVRTVLPML